MLYTATAGELRGRKLPLSFYDTAEYWGEYVCKQRGVDCVVTDRYNPNDYTVTPPRGVASVRAVASYTRHQPVLGR